MLENLKVSRIVRIVFSCLWIRKRGIRMTTTIKFQFYFVVGLHVMRIEMWLYDTSKRVKNFFEEAPIIYFQLKELRFFQSTFTYSISNKANSKFSVMDLWISLYKKYQIWISFMLQSEEAWVQATIDRIHKMFEVPTIVTRHIKCSYVFHV